MGNLAGPSGGRFPKADPGSCGCAAGTHWFAGYGMLVAGGFCYGRLLDES
jgi:hypothetical protein